MEYRVGLRPNRATVVEDDSHDSSWERMLLGSFVPRERKCMGTKRPGTLWHAVTFVYFSTTNILKTDHDEVKFIWECEHYL